MIGTRKKLQQEIKTLRSRLVSVRVRINQGMDFTHENPTYKRGWEDALKYINEVARDKNPVVRNPSRQSTVTRRTDEV